MRNLRSTTSKAVIVATILVAILVAIGWVSGIVQWRAMPLQAPEVFTDNSGDVAGEGEPGGLPVDKLQASDKTDQIKEPTGALID